MRKKAIAAGHICIDITPVFPENGRQAESLGEILKPGTLVHTLAPDIHTGGSAANTGLGMKIMGADVRVMGKIGEDAFGGMIRDILRRYDAEKDLITVPGETTSYSMVIAAPGIDRIFLHCPGANDTFDGSEIPEEALRDIALFHFGYPPLMKKMYENDGVHLIRMFRRMKEAGIATSLDLAAIDPYSEAGRTDWKRILESVLPYVDFFVPSFEELMYILDRPRYEELKQKSAGCDITEILSVEEDVRSLAERCLAIGARAILLKCGVQGLMLMASEKMAETGERLGLDARAWNGFSCFEESYRVDRVLSGAGAGDVCIAAFLSSILEGAEPKTSIENAAAAGALCCMSMDAVSSLMPLSGIRKKIDEGWEKRKK